MQCLTASWIHLLKRICCGSRSATVNTTVNEVVQEKVQTNQREIPGMS